MPSCASRSNKSLKKKLGYGDLAVAAGESEPVQSKGKLSN